MKRDALFPPSRACGLQGRTALVTGGARGIGAGIARVLAREGAAVAVCDLLPCDDVLAELRAQGYQALGVQADVTDIGQVRRAVDETIAALGRLDILVNNAGVVHRHPFMETTVEVWDKVVDVVLRGVFLGMQAAYPHMREQGYGKIVNVSSISGIIGGAVSKPDDPPELRRGRPGPAYAAAKGGVLALTRWAAKDFAKDGIWVNAIAPGPCESEMTRGYDYGVKSLPIARDGQPQDMAEAVFFL
ncbi:MAG: SDR family NAD(P)-dependent oxidoreductase, partial [Desulfarculaceae bacterium]|nr:SDR family NAD(P)-dependent oxidoreductase [Desulfarculaceae bacterium]